MEARGSVWFGSITCAELGATDPVRIVLKPSRPVRVRVNDAAGLPVSGAAVEAIDPSFQTHATTGPDGTATLRVPADAKVRWVIGLKAGAGFDYFENYRTKPAADYPPLPAELSLTLDGARNRSSQRGRLDGPAGSGR